jgi:hypothetical protein
MADIPYQMGQNTNQQGLGVLQRTGSLVSGGSTVSASPMLGGGAQPGSPTSLVYLGPNTKGTRPPTGPYAPGYTAPYTGANGGTWAELANAPTTWDAKELKSFINKGIVYKIPGFSTDMGMPEAVDAWQKLMMSAQQFSQSGTDWSPYDVMESYNKAPGAFGTIKSPDGDWLLDARTGDRIKYIGPRSKTTTEKRIDLSSAEDVRALTTQMLTELLGRAPSPEEMSKYRTAMGSFEQAHPSVATTTTTINEKGEAVGSNTTTSGGVTQEGRAQLISEQAKQGPEYGKFQGATTYFNAMMQMLGG